MMGKQLEEAKKKMAEEIGAIEDALKMATEFLRKKKDGQIPD